MGRKIYRVFRAGKIDWMDSSMRKLIKKITNIISKREKQHWYRLYLKNLISEKTNYKKRILEVGCSQGETYVCAEDQIYVGIDLDFHYLEGFRKSIKSTNYILVQADATKLPFADNSFDAVYTLSTFMIMDKEQIQTALEKILTVAQRDAIFIFDFLNRNSIQFWFTKKQFWDNDPRFFYRGLSFGGAKKLLKETNYEITEIKSILFIPYFITLKLGWKWLFKLDLLLSGIFPYFACKNIFVCRKRNENL